MNGRTACLLTPNECVLALIDHQPQMLSGAGSHERLTIANNAVALAKAARLFNVPVVLSRISAGPFDDALLSEVRAVFPDQPPIDRTTMNAWESRAFRAAVENFGRRKLVIAGMWTQMCVFPVLSAIQEGYDVYFAADACGDITVEAHERAVQRAIQAGAVPMTALQTMFEWQRDWARTETSAGAMEILAAHSAFGIGAR